MTASVATRYTKEQIVAWLRGLLSVAWADGNFEEHEREFITSLTKEGLAAEDTQVDAFSEPITPQELAASLGNNTDIGANFLRTAVMVAIADGTYSACESDLLRQFCQALGQPEQVLDALQHTLAVNEPESDFEASALPLQIDPLHPVRDWLDALEIQDPKLARFLCKMIPPQCPFERNIQLFGHKIVHIPPLCKLNPLYEQLVGLRFRALSYLADDCKQDISEYI